MAKPKIVYIVSRFPFPLEKGDKLRAYYQIKELAPFYDIYLMSLSDKKVNQQQIAELKPFCKEIHVYFLPIWTILFQLTRCLLNGKPFQIGYFYSFRHALRMQHEIDKIKPDHIFSQLVRTTEYVKDYHECPKTVDYMDALSKGMDRRAKEWKGLKKLIYSSEAKRLRKYERTIFDYFEHKLIISEQDKHFIIHPDFEKIEVVPNGIDASFFQAKKATEKLYDLVFVGNLSYAPNIKAANYIVEHIAKWDPSLKILIAGANPSSELKAKIKKHKQVALSGWMDDIKDAYLSGKIFIAPMTNGTGMQNKLLEAMALGIPCITTNLANNGILATPNKTIIVANTPEQFQENIVLLLKEESIREEISQAAKSWVKEKYNWKEINLRLMKIFLK